MAIQLANKNNIKTESATKILEIASFILLHYLKSNEVTKDSFKNYFLNNKNSPVLQDENIKTEEHLSEKIILEIPIEEYVKDKGNTKKKFLVFAFILMVVMAIVYFTIFNPTQQVKLNDPTIVESKNTVGPSQSIEQADIRTLGEFIEFSLPDNILHIPSKGVEKAMLDYILDSDNALDTGGFTLEFDRVSFLKRENNFDQSSTE